MRTIGIDYTPACHQGAGIGRYVRELVNALVDLDTPYSYRMFVSGVNRNKILPAFSDTSYTWRATAVSPRWLARLWHRARVPLPIETWTGQLDLFHATDFVLPPTRSTTRTLLTVHDLSYIRVPDTASPKLKRYLDNVVPRSVARADHILADSAATKRDLIELYAVSPDKITVLLSGVDERFRHISTPTMLHAVRNKYGLGDWPFLFTIGTVQPRKNYTRLCEALQILHRQHPDLHLVIAGGRGWLEDPLYDAIQDLRLGEYVHFIGFADDEDLPALYSLAKAVPFVSLYEGFGLPVLEAMACGVPVVTSNISSLPEVAGEAATLINPYDVNEIAEAINQFLIDPLHCATAVKQGHEHAAKFTWENSAKALSNVYETLLSGT